MKKNRIPTEVRIRLRIQTLQYKVDSAHVKSPHKGNPYWCCAECGIHDPSLSIANGKHFKGCSIGGYTNQIRYLRGLLEQLEKEKNAVV